MSLAKAESLRQWLRTCPAVAGSSRFGVDYLSENPDELAVYTVPSEIKYRENILGDLIPADTQTESYIVASRSVYGSDASQNAANLDFFWALADWIIQQNRVGNFPVWDGRILHIKPTLSAAPVQIGAGSAVYELHIQVTYRR